ncbi:MAG TPA: FecR domain-containing protein [Rhizomicrobium sp.]
MSDAIQETSNPNARDVRAKAAEWLERRENVGDSDDEALNAWLAESPAHEIAYWRLEAAWKHADRLSALRRPGLKEFFRAGRRWISVAAILGLALIGAGAVAFLQSGGRDQSFSTPIGGHESITLADGSQIELNTDTALRVADSAHQRLVWLDRGEAYFKIRHNAARPFVVRIGNHRVTDIGTAFTIRRDANQIEVSLLEGRARLETANLWEKSNVAILSSGDLAVAGTHGLSVTKKPLPMLARELAWRSGKLVFDHVTLADAAAQLNRYNHRQVVIVDPSVALLAIDGTFPVSGVSEFSHAAKEVFGLRVEQLGDETVISR